MKKTLKRTLLLITALMLVAAMLAGCSGKSDDSATVSSPPPAGTETSNQPEQSQQPQQSQEPGNAPGYESPDVQPPPSERPLRVSTNTTFASIDPHYCAQNADLYLSSLLYEGFYDVDDLGVLTPRLATDYEVSEDGTVYTYHLKSGVKWQTGGDFTSADVLYSIARAQESPYTYDYVAYIVDVEAPDELTVVITLAMMSPTFDVDINRVWFLSEAAVGDLDVGFTNEIQGGTGPYTLATWRPDSKVTVSRNPRYHWAPAPIGDIEITVFGDSNAALRSFEAGELDYVPVPTSDWERISGSGKYKTYIQDTISVVFGSMNNQVAPFDDPLVRQAFNYAVDIDDMIYAIDGFGSPASVLGNSALLFGIPKPGEIFEYSYDPSMAMELLAEAGYPDGLTLDEPLLTMATDEFSIPAQVLQAQLEAIGVNVEIRTEEQSALVMDLILGNYSIAIMGLSLPVDASMVTMAYKTDYIDALNLARYSNPIVDDLFAQADSTLDKQERIRLYQEAFDIASREAAYIPLYAMQAGFATAPELQSSVYTNWYYWYWD